MIKVHVRNMTKNDTFGVVSRYSVFVGNCSRQRAIGECLALTGGTNDEVTGGSKVQVQSCNERHLTSNLPVIHIIIRR